MCTLLMLIGGCLWGYVIGTFCGAIANLSPSVHEFRRNMDDLNGYIASNRINAALSQRLREFFHQTKHLNDAPNHARLLQMLSPALQAETVLSVNQMWLRRVRNRRRALPPLSCRHAASPCAARAACHLALCRALRACTPAWRLSHARARAYALPPPPPPPARCGSSTIATSRRNSWCD